MAKFTTLLMLATYLAEERSDEVSYARFLGGLMIVGAPATLIIIQPDLGSASVLVSMAMGVLLVAGAKARYIALITLLSVATVLAAFVSRMVNSYQAARIRALVNPAAANADDLYQAENAMRAIGTGGVWGKGWLQGPLTNGRDIPVMWADFPFAAIGEQFGLVGSSVVLALFAVALMRIWRIASLSRDLLGTYICAGVFTMVLWQTFQNVGMTLQIMPVTGLPLPFISYGGSSLIVYFACSGSCSPCTCAACAELTDTTIRWSSRQIGPFGVELCTQWPAATFSPPFRVKVLLEHVSTRQLRRTPAVRSRRRNGSVIRRVRGSRSAETHRTTRTVAVRVSAHVAALPRRERQHHGTHRQHRRGRARDIG